LPTARLGVEQPAQQSFNTWAYTPMNGDDSSAVLREYRTYVSERPWHKSQRIERNDTPLPLDLRRETGKFAIDRHSAELLIILILLLDWATLAA
jgi:hypothetical protein